MKPLPFIMVTTTLWTCTSAAFAQVPADHSHTTPMEDVGSVSLELAAGLSASAAGFASFAVSTRLATGSGDSSIIGGVVGSTMATVPTVWGMGHALGRQGDLGWTVAGSLAGLGAGLGVMALAREAEPDRGFIYSAAPDEWIAGFVALLALPAAGAVAGFELSNDGSRADKAPSELTLVPTLDVSASAVRAGLAGSF